MMLSYSNWKCCESWDLHGDGTHGNPAELVHERFGVLMGWTQIIMSWDSRRPPVGKLTRNSSGNVIVLISICRQMNPRFSSCKCKNECVLKLSCQSKFSISFSLTLRGCLTMDWNSTGMCGNDNRRGQVEMKIKWAEMRGNWCNFSSCQVSRWKW